MMPDHVILMSVVFFLIAMIYSSAGFAGGSSYLAVLMLFGLSYTQVPKIALICNLIVSVIAFHNFYKAGHFEFRTVLPFIIFSIPMAYLGARVPVSKETFCLLLGLSLAVAGFWLLFPDKHDQEIKPMASKKFWSLGLPAGALMGFLSGLVGIGGGIFLSPFLILSKFAQAKKAAAAASFFILVNSISGLVGQFQKSSMPSLDLFISLALAVIVGGQIGSLIGSGTLPKKGVQRITAVLVLFVAYKLLSRSL